MKEIAFLATVKNITKCSYYCAVRIECWRGRKAVAVVIVDCVLAPPRTQLCTHQCMYKLYSYIVQFLLCRILLLSSIPCLSCVVPNLYQLSFHYSLLAIGIAWFVCLWYPLLEIGLSIHRTNCTKSERFLLYLSHVGQTDWYMVYFELSLSLLWSYPLIFLGCLL